VRAAPPSWGRHPKTFTISDISRGANQLLYSITSSAREYGRWDIVGARLQLLFLNQ
jgi:hypothetical protein